ncbi:helix-turn-helix domain-containing protein [Paracoccus rhizosphaerae]|uniref:Helix-turn-helix domain-containing protein n=1 Tax=Paracoccus rhizosphaerae TaxID=1133347 RepID=A0ABV6CKX3_9RHOB|nr:helix-turn-helix transcriptional regulator [Paracoccus rhizosphaerae]
MPVVEKFGRNVRAARHAAGFSQEELAHRSGLHRTYIGGIERGERNPSLENIVALAIGLGCSAPDLRMKCQSWCRTHDICWRLEAVQRRFGKVIENGI